MSTHVLSNRSNGNGLREITNLNRLPGSQYRHVRDPKLLPKKPIKDVEIQLIKKVYNQSYNYGMNYVEMKITTDHTAETSTLTVEWGDGTTETFTPNSSGVVYIGRKYSYSATGLSTYDSTEEIKQAQIRIYPTNDDFNFRRIDNHDSMASNITARDDNHMILNNFTEVRLNNVGGEFQFHSLTAQWNQSANDPLGDVNMKSHVSMNTELEYYEIFDIASGNTISLRHLFNMPLKSVIIHDANKLKIDDIFDENHQLEEIIVLGSSSSGAASEMSFNQDNFGNCKALKYFYMSTGGTQNLTFQGRAFSSLISLKFFYMDNITNMAGGYQQAWGNSSLEEVIIKFKSGCTMSDMHGLFAFANALKWVNNPMHLPGGNHLDLSNITGSGTPDDYEYLFGKATSLEQIKVTLPNKDHSGYDTEFTNAFRECGNLKDLEIVNPNTNTVHLSAMQSFLTDCGNLEKFTLTGNFRVDNKYSTLNLNGAFKDTTLSYSDLPTAFQTLYLDGTSTANTYNFFQRNWKLQEPPKIIFDNNNGSVSTSLDLTELNGIFHEGGPHIWNCATKVDLTDFQQTTTTANGWLAAELPTLIEFTGFDFSAFHWTGGQDVNFEYNMVLEKWSGHTYPAANVMFNINLRYSRLSASEIDTLLTELPDLTGETSRNINLNNALGIASADTSIATNKNWTVTT
jgi:hypothetical protein